MVKEKIKISQFMEHTIILAMFFGAGLIGLVIFEESELAILIPLIFWGGSVCHIIGLIDRKFGCI